MEIRSKKSFLEPLKSPYSMYKQFKAVVQCSHLLFLSEHPFLFSGLLNRVSMEILKSNFLMKLYLIFLRRVNHFF